MGVVVGIGEAALGSDMAGTGMESGGEIRFYNRIMYLDSTGWTLGIIGMNSLD